MDEKERGLRDFVDNIHQALTKVKGQIAEIDATLRLLLLRMDTGDKETARLNQIVRDGNGQPSLQTKVFAMEKDLGSLKREIKSIHGDMDGLTARADKMDDDDFQKAKDDIQNRKQTTGDVVKEVLKILIASALGVWLGRH